MAKITNKSSKMRLIVDKYLFPGESREISAKQLGPYRNDPDLEIVEDQPLQVEPEVVDDAALQPQTEADLVPAAGSESALLKVQVEVVEPEVPGDSLEEKADFGEPELEVEPPKRSKKARGEVQKPVEVQTLKKSRSKRK